MKFAIKKATGALLGAALALMLTTKGFADESEAAEDLISPILLEEQLAEPELQAKDSKEADSNELEAPGFEDQADDSAIAEPESFIPAASEVAIIQPETVFSAAPETTDDFPLVPEASVTESDESVAAAQSTGEDVSLPTPPVLPPQPTLQVGDEQLEGSTSSNWSSNSGWFYTQDSDSITMVDAQLGTISAAGRDISLVTAGLNRINSLVIEDGNINVVGTGILLIDNVEMTGDGFSFNLLEYSSDQFSNGSTAVFIWDADQDAYVLCNGSIAGILDDSYVIPEGVKLLTPEGTSLVLTTTLGSSTGEDRQPTGTAGTLQIAAGAELTVGGSLDVLASGFTGPNSQNYTAQLAVSTVSVQGALNILQGGGVYLEGSLVVDGGSLDCEDYITSGAGDSWDVNGGKLNQQGQVIIQKDSAAGTIDLMVNSTDVLVKTDGVAIDSITSSGSSLIGICGGDKNRNWHLDLGDVTIVDGDLYCNGYLVGGNNPETHSEVTVNGSVTGSGTFCIDCGTATFRTAPSANVEVTESAVAVIPTGTGKTSGRGLILPADASPVTETNAITVQLIQAVSILDLEKYCKADDSGFTYNLIGEAQVTLTTNEDDYYYAYPFYFLEGGPDITAQYIEEMVLPCLFYDYQKDPYGISFMVYEVVYQTPNGLQTAILDHNSTTAIPVSQVCAIRMIDLSVWSNNAFGNKSMNTDTSLSTTGTISSGGTVSTGSNSNSLRTS
ncbi:MAG: hypothetical protein MJ135_03985, partial [Oscillospiraceae bacterium]|nr:hypothetical protein [Oscillospiraceae bacterium]